jgi:hypothetical protein
MLEVVTGLNGLVKDEVGRIWFNREPNRGAVRKGARLIKVTRMKREIEARRRRRPFERASLIGGKI